MKKKQKMYACLTCTIHGDEDEVENNPLSSCSEEKPLSRRRREWRQLANSDDFRVEILEFESKLDINEFLEWLHIVEHIFQ